MVLDGRGGPLSGTQREYLGNARACCDKIRLGLNELLDKTRSDSADAPELTKNGNKHLSWAFVEAANFAIRYNPKIKRFYQRKKDQTNTLVAIKAVAHKLARACYYVMRDQVPFQVEKAFG